MTTVIVSLFAVYAAAVTWQMRRALAATEPQGRLREARRLLLFVSAGLPLLALLILVAL